MPGKASSSGWVGPTRPAPTPETCHAQDNRPPARPRTVRGHAPLRLEANGSLPDGPLRQPDPPDRSMDRPRGRPSRSPPVLALRRALLARHHRPVDHLVAAAPLLRPRDAPVRTRRRPGRDGQVVGPWRPHGEELAVPASPAAPLCTFELARAHGPAGMAVRTHIPPLPLRHLSRLPDSLQSSHRRWLVEQRLPEPEQMRRRAQRLADGLAGAGSDRAEIERQLARWHFHPSVGFRAAEEAVRKAGRGSAQPGSSSWPAGVSPQ